MDWQWGVTALLVVGCAFHALRNLWPRAWWPRNAPGVAAASTSAGSACGGCDGCSSVTKPPRAAVGPPLAAGESVVRIVRRPAGQRITG